MNFFLSFVCLCQYSLTDGIRALATPSHAAAQVTGSDLPAQKTNNNPVISHVSTTKACFQCGFSELWGLLLCALTVWFPRRLVARQLLLSMSTFAGSPLPLSLSFSLFLFLSLSLSPRLAPKEWKFGIWNLEACLTSLWQSLGNHTPEIRRGDAADLSSVRPAVIQGAPDLSGVDESREQKGLQRFNTLSFLAKTWDVKVLLPFFFLSFVYFQSGLGDASYWTDESWTTGLSLLTRELACKTKNNFSSYLHGFPPTATSAECREMRVRLPYIISREAVRHGWDRTSGAKVTATCGWASGPAERVGVMGCRQTGVVIVIGLPSMQPWISFPAGLRAPRVRFHGQHAAHPCYAHLLKTSPVIQGWQTTHSQSDQPERPHSQRWGSPTTRTVHPARFILRNCLPLSL